MCEKRTERIYQMKMNNIYILFDEKTDMNMFYLLLLYSIAEYDTTTNSYSIINYESIKQLYESIVFHYGNCISYSSFYRMLYKNNNTDYFSVNQ